MSSDPAATVPTASTTPSATTTTRTEDGQQASWQAASTTPFSDSSEQPETAEIPGIPQEQASPTNAHSQLQQTSNRSRRGFSDVDVHSASTYSSARQPDSPTQQPLPGPPTATGQPQSLRDFLQNLDSPNRPSRYGRPRHRHSFAHSSYSDSASARSAAAASTALPVPAGLSHPRTGRRGSDDRTGRRRSTPTLSSAGDGMRQAHDSTASATTDSSAIPDTPPPSYERGNYRGGNDQEADREPPHPGRRITTDHLSSNFYVKPKWQPDNDVADCPICRRPFTFFFRKHHCRKCGRVVCATCSPHRITIPKQYIVEPPIEGSEGEHEETLRADRGEDGSVESAMFGGEEVRLCNPCVPDPNPLPPLQYDGNTQSVLSPFSPRHFSDEQAQLFYGTQPRYPRRTTSQRDWVGAHDVPGSDLSRQRSSTDPNHWPFFTTSGPHTPFGQGQSAAEQATGGRDAVAMHAAGSRRSGLRHRSAASTSVLPSPAHSQYLQSFAPSRTDNDPRDAPLPPVPAQRTPPRRIAEEDECPICHEELPPKGPDGDESAREQHISSCIDSHLAPRMRALPTTPSSEEPIPGASASSAPSSSSMPHRYTQSVSGGAGASSSTPYEHHGGGRPRAETQTAGGPGPETYSRYKSNTMRRANMLVYHASEKDCIDAEGRQKECVICLEDFVVSAELGRLECWCVFHRTCIREWWDTKGLGACPTHQTGL